MDLKQIKSGLLASKAQIESRLERTHKHIYNKDEPVSPNFNEQIKETENDQLVHALELEGQEELVQINAALKRLESGEYATCVDCGQAITEQRLLAIPYTSQCIDCATRVE